MHHIRLYRHDKGHQFGGRPIPHEPLLNGVSSKTIYRPDHGFVLARMLALPPRCAKGKSCGRGAGSNPPTTAKGLRRLNAARPTMWYEVAVQRVHRTARLDRAATLAVPQRRVCHSSQSLTVGPYAALLLHPHQITVTPLPQKSLALPRSKVKKQAHPHTYGPRSICVTASPSTAGNREPTVIEPRVPLALGEFAPRRGPASPAHYSSGNRGTGLSRETSNQRLWTRPRGRGSVSSTPAATHPARVLRPVPRAFHPAPSP